MTLSFNLLGNLGRLGNQMFQLASLMGIANNNNLDFIIPPKEYFGQQDPNVRVSDANIFNTFKLKSFNYGITTFSNFEERYFHFDEELFNNCSENLNLNGYFQCPKYFNHISKEVKESFTFLDDIQEVCNKSFDENFSGTDVASLHVRRGDYLNYTHHPVQSLEYYSQGISCFPENIPILVFSDDVEWCKSQELFSGDRFLISENRNTKIDLCLMTMCSYHIIANSSFSWWGAWLANSKQVIAPSNWFGLPYTHDTKDLYCENWKVC